MTHIVTIVLSVNGSTVQWQVFASAKSTGIKTIHNSAIKVDSKQLKRDSRRSSEEVVRSTY